MYKIEIRYISPQTGMPRLRKTKEYKTRTAYDRWLSTHIEQFGIHLVTGYEQQNGNWVRINGPNHQ